MKKFSEMHLSDLTPGNLIKMFKANQAEAEKEHGIVPETTNDFEINLVPDVKLELIRTIRMRNLLMLIAMVILGVSWGLVVILGSVYGGQEIAMAGKDRRLDLMSQKLNSYNELTEFLTIQDQMGKISEIAENKQVLSRVFSIMSVILPSDKDTITLSELNVNMKNQTLTFDGQANAGVKPDIDYRVLESFKKSLALTKYDYGRYVDAEGNEIPTRCVVETNSNGEMLNKKGQIYVIWKRSRRGCDPTRDDYYEEEEEVATGDDDDAEETKSENNSTTTNNTEKTEKKETDEEKRIRLYPDEIIYRTPQFNSWYTDKADGKKIQVYSDAAKTTKARIYSNVSMGLDGSIDGIPHFESNCISYSGTEVTDEEGKSKVQWESTNESCMLLAEDGIKVDDSNNGRDSNNNLVLRFSARMTLTDEVLKFANKHVMAIGPTRANVTDSYAQLESMFAERATDCSETDVTCKNNTKNAGQ